MEIENVLTELLKGKNRFKKNSGKKERKKERKDQFPHNSAPLET